MDFLFMVYSGGKLNLTYKDGEDTPCVSGGPEKVALAQAVLATLPEGAQGFQLRPEGTQIEVLLADGNVLPIAQPSEEQAQAVLALLPMLAL